MTSLLNLQFIPVTADEKSDIAQSDLDTLVRLSTQTFLQAYEGEIDPAEMEKYTREAFHPDVWQASLREPGHSLWFSTLNDEAMGYCSLRTQRPAQAIPGSETPIQIERFYLDKAFHGQQIAQRMMAFCLEEAKKRGADSVWLGVWEKNRRAQRFYEKSGFRVVGNRDFKMGTTLHNDYIMSLALTDR